MSRLRTVLAVSAVSVSALIPLAAQTAPAPTPLPEGPGKALVEQVCTQCHNVNQIRNSSGYTRAQWQELIGYMADLSGSPKQRDEIVNYLVTNFPPNQKRAPKSAEGALKINIQSWKAPKLGQRARDPIETPDGMIWWAGQFGNVVGRLDPRTGQMREFELPMGARPHSIVSDAQGNVWYMGNANGTIGRIDGKTFEIKVYPMPDPMARDPHSAVFDQRGTLWFTLQNSQMVGRLIPASGEIKLVKVPTPDSNPYGIKIDAQGSPWVACAESNCILKLDANTMAIREYKLPKPGTTVRRLGIASDGIVWYTNSALGFIGRLDPATGQTREWASPSGATSHPYGLEVINDVVWYNESGQRPDMLVRFDPKTEKFQSWPIASGNVHAGIVRNMGQTKNGDLLIHQSSTNHIMRVSVAK